MMATYCPQFARFTVTGMQQPQNKPPRKGVKRVHVGPHSTAFGTCPE
jgi:hypothetical protein